MAYQQPNHFFNHSIPDSRLDEACATARRHGMAMEFEFDEKATAAIPNSSHDRMAAYINHFEKNDVFNSSAVAYYCGNRGVLTLDESDNPKDKTLMDRLARIIQARRYLKYGIPMKNKTRVVAHRGFWHTDGSAQNSIASLLKADQLGVYGVEFDVWMASDGVPVLKHDGWHDGYEVQSTPSTVLTTLKLENGELMPTLAQYLEAAKDTKVHLVLELKPHATPEAETAAAEAVVKMVGRYGLSKRVTYISFSLHIMKELARLAPAKTQLMYLGGGTLPKDLKAMDASLSYKNATMKHLRIMACLLLLGCMAPATALCAGEHAPKRSRGKGHDRPYSEAMYVKRQGGDLYISAKLDERTDITYWFRRCMFNELYTFYRVGITRNRAALPSTQPEAEPAVLLNSTYSDNIGPFAIPGCGWVTPCWPTATASKATRRYGQIG